MQYSENLHLNLPEDSDPLEVSKLSENFEVLDTLAIDTTFKVGDMLATTRTDLGDSWLLCNGDSINDVEHPELCGTMHALLTTAAENKIVYNFGISNATREINNYATDGEIFAVAFRNGDNFGEILYSSDDFDTIKSVSLPTTAYAYSRIFYANNKWIIVSQYTNSIQGVFDADSLDGPWNYRSSLIENRAIIHLEHRNGYYWLFGVKGLPYSSGISYGPCWYAKVAGLNLTGLEPTDVAVTGAAPFFVRTDKFVFASSLGGSVYLTVADDPSGEWAQQDPIIIPNATSVSSSVYYTNETYYGICSIDGRSNMGVYSIKNGVAEAIYAGYSGASVSFNIGAHQAIALVGDVLCAVLRSSSIAVYQIGAQDITSYEPNNNIDTKSVDLYDNSCSAVAITKNRVLFTGRRVSGNIATPCMFAVDKYALPSISIPPAYVYIKAKEDTQNANQQADTPAP